MLCFSLNENINSHNTRHRNYPLIQARNTNIMTKSFICKEPEIRLGLPNEIKPSKLGLHSIIALRNTSSHKIEWSIDYLARGCTHVRVVCMSFFYVCLCFTSAHYCPTQGTYHLLAIVHNMFIESFTQAH